MQKEFDDRGNPLICTGGTCRVGGRSISLIINHCENTNAKPDDVLLRFLMEESSRLGEPRGAWLQSSQALLTCESEGKNLVLDIHYFFHSFFRSIVLGSIEIRLAGLKLIFTVTFQHFFFLFHFRRVYDF